VLPSNGRGASGHQWLTWLLAVDAEAGVELVDVQLPVEPEVVRIGAQEALDVGLGREGVERLLL
jgi:hypothetical protein